MTDLLQKARRKAWIICIEYQHKAEKCDWRDGATQARRIGRRIGALIDTIPTIKR